MKITIEIDQELHDWLKSRYPHNRPEESAAAILEIYIKERMEEDVNREDNR